MTDPRQNSADNNAKTPGRSAGNVSGAGARPATAPSSSISKEELKERIAREVASVLPRAVLGDGPLNPETAETRHEGAQKGVMRRRAIESLDLTIPAELPISTQADTIVSLLRQHSTIVVSGETGSGKSTQLPKLCLAAGLGQTGLIGHTQPRRLAAQSIAARLAEELKTQLGSQVGFKIRFADQTKPETLVKLMTDGILLAETQSDRNLDAYDAIIIDEAHERSLNIDFLLGYLHRLRQRRPRLRTIVTSATIDAERFAEHFGDESGPAPIVVVEGRSYPVELRYRPWEDITGLPDDEANKNYDISRHVIEGIDETMACGSGDILVFLPTERDIREVSSRPASPLRASAPIRTDSHFQSHRQQTSDHLCHQRCRIIVDGPRHPLCRRYGVGSDQSLQSTQQSPAAADRTGQPSERTPALRSMRSRSGGCLRAAVFRIRF
jgi:HrpA-like RNA helicase